jgi:hypothetical protein
MDRNKGRSVQVVGVYILKIEEELKDWVHHGSVAMEKPAGHSGWSDRTSEALR